MNKVKNHAIKLLGKKNTSNKNNSYFISKYIIKSQ